MEDQDQYKRIEQEGGQQNIRVVSSLIDNDEEKV